MILPKAEDNYPVEECSKNQRDYFSIYRFKPAILPDV